MAFDNAEIGASTIIEPGAEIGFRYSDDCGPARIGAHGIIRRGTLIYGDVSIADHFQSGHNTTIRGKVRIGDYCTVTNNSTLEGLIRQRWLDKSAQRVKWSFCLKAAKMAAEQEIR